MPLPSRIDADRRYEKIREIALETTQNYIDNKFKLTKITQEAINATELWSASQERRYLWDWRKNYTYYRISYPKRFEIAVWEKNSMLTAISLGRPTYNASDLRLDIAEAMPRGLGERSNVFDTIILAYEIYARMINANQFSTVIFLQRTFTSSV